MHGNEVCLHADKAVQMNNHTGHVHGYMQPRAILYLHSTEMVTIKTNFRIEEMYPIRPHPVITSLWGAAGLALYKKCFPTVCSMRVSWLQLHTGVGNVGS